MSTWYDDTASGQCGNADCGQMSAWYVFSALGIYPVNPASGVFVIGSPIVTKAVLNLDRDKYHGHTFTVIPGNNSKENVYIQSATLNGKPLHRPWISREEIISGGTLRFEMGSQANPGWGSASEDRPPATLPAHFQYPPIPEPAPAGK